jgi:hypothetical protein
LKEWFTENNITIGDKKHKALRTLFAKKAHLMDNSIVCVVDSERCAEQGEQLDWVNCSRCDACWMHLECYSMAFKEELSTKLCLSCRAEPSKKANTTRKGRAKNSQERSAQEQSARAGARAGARAQKRAQARKQQAAAPPLEQKADSDLVDWIIERMPPVSPYKDMDCAPGTLLEIIIPSLCANPLWCKLLTPNAKAFLRQNLRYRINGEFARARRDIYTFMNKQLTFADRNNLLQRDYTLGQLVDITLVFDNLLDLRVQNGDRRANFRLVAATTCDACQATGSVCINTLVAPPNQWLSPQAILDRALRGRIKRCDVCHQDTVSKTGADPTVAAPKWLTFRSNKSEVHLDNDSLLITPDDSEISLLAHTYRAIGYVYHDLGHFFGDLARDPTNRDELTHYNAQKGHMGVQAPNHPQTRPLCCGGVTFAERHRRSRRVESALQPFHTNRIALVVYELVDTI